MDQDLRLTAEEALSIIRARLGITGDLIIIPAPTDLDDDIRNVWLVGRPGWLTADYWPIEVDPFNLKVIMRDGLGGYPAEDRGLLVSYERS